MVFVFNKERYRVTVRAAVASLEVLRHCCGKKVVRDEEEERVIR